jgi:hypothetical protein
LRAVRVPFREYYCPDWITADLITAMTWPIDVAEELKELDDEMDGSTDYTTLIEAQRSYKASLLRPGAIAALFAVILPSLAREKGSASLGDHLARLT